MDGESASSEITRISPNRAGALIALQSASDLLLLARERFSHRDYRGALKESRNAIRMASSAVLFSDGVVSGSLEATLAYLSERHPGALPVEGWHRLEEMPDEDSAGLYSLIMAAMGKLKKTGRQDAEDAITLAESFIFSASAEMSI